MEQQNTLFIKADDILVGTVNINVDSENVVFHIMKEEKSNNLLNGIIVCVEVLKNMNGLIIGIKIQEK